MSKKKENTENKDTTETAQIEVPAVEEINDGLDREVLQNQKEAELLEREENVTQRELAVEKREKSLDEREAAFLEKLETLEEEKVPQSKEAGRFHFNGGTYRFSDFAPQVIKVMGEIRTQEEISQNEDLLEHLILGGSALIEKI